MTTFDEIQKFFSSIISGDYFAVSDFLSSGISPNARYRGESALRAALKNGKFSIAGLLINSKADVDEVLEDSKDTLLIHALIIEDMIGARLLIDGGADVNKPGEDGGAPIIHAAMLNDPDLIDLLIMKKADINHQDLAGDSALIVSAYSVQSNSLKRLLALGANTDLRDKLGQAALVYAMLTNHEENIRDLLKYGASPYLFTEDGAPKINELGEHDTIASLLTAESPLNTTQILELQKQGRDFLARKNSAGAFTL